METITEICDFLIDGKQSPYIAMLLTKYGQQAVQQVGITLLWWLREYANGTRNPLDLDPEDKLDRFVYDFLVNGELNNLLELSENQVAFRQDVPADVRDRVLTYVAINYKPEDKLLDK